LKDEVKFEENFEYFSKAQTILKKKKQNQYTKIKESKKVNNKKLPNFIVIF